MSWVPVKAGSEIRCPLCEGACTIVSVREAKATRFGVHCPRCSFAYTAVASSLASMRDGLADLVSLEQAGPGDEIIEAIEEPIATVVPRGTSTKSVSRSRRGALKRSRPLAVAVPTISADLAALRGLLA